MNIEDKLVVNRIFDLLNNISQSNRVDRTDFDKILEIFDDYLRHHNVEKKYYNCFVAGENLGNLMVPENPFRGCKTEYFEEFPELSERTQRARSICIMLTTVAHFGPQSSRKGAAKLFEFIEMEGYLPEDVIE